MLCVCCECVLCVCVECVCCVCVCVCCECPFGLVHMSCCNVTSLFRVLEMLLHAMASTGWLCSGDWHQRHPPTGVGLHHEAPKTMLASRSIDSNKKTSAVRSLLHQLTNIKLTTTDVIRVSFNSHCFGQETVHEL